MKNKYIPSVFFAALTAFLISCGKDFLEKTPVSALTTDTFYKTASDAEAGLAGAYSFGNSEYYLWDFEINGDVRSDNCYAGGNSGDVQAVDNLNLAPTNGNISRDWSYLYRCVASANSVLDNVPRINDPALSSERKEQILGEAKFLRALHYFNLVILYGEVPLVLTAENAELYPSRDPVAEVYGQVEKDLQEAGAVLPVRAAAAGRVTKGAAQALLAKAYAQQGKYDACLAACNSILPPKFGGSGTGGYDLLSDFEFLWDNKHKNSIESIFEVQHSSTSTGFGMWTINLYLPYSLTGDTWAKFCSPSNDLVNLFRSSGDSVRLHSSVFFENTQTTNTTPPPYTAATQPVPFSYKWRMTGGGGWNGDYNTILIRLADIILLKAEALNKLGRPADAAPLVNAIRGRVNLLPTSASGQAAMAEAILLERRLELAFEGQRWMDLLRAGVPYTLSVMNSLKGPSGNNLNYGAVASDLLFPVPQAERDLDKNLSQNTGY
ncbi:RagB/SusD family nutrient uptake outer membrane protein [Chitinophaga barathri]|uniref:RagB/SusD family nutrient uptake outer membrane protein n=1 Tax=Chitinophaga barathri TaxID=1647451 RepID=A0A3N4MLW6_9BACT|nr:RagB/SusD family nutrient uptake outer membrane protein [Chitinophaga barathri]RPD42987.1 RagB/SusD family nutrient uptake outer membrane protein [Chitinophaga barathri]